ncbi:VCBS repeat-containing protein [Streptomyces sp. BPTC-684]|uniref:FG-GAP repeat domain-containing protein n=1 Tax=Streptomyces sp. BPTC-684 TaxID=3043734 RepID=UPI0024B27C13|nr:VCBS repeat-containing protein [Streptomyces sp. BPTC-684]WHM41076.1 VCBS repeat-containing protein [Streptomyces sp. BPTC-684]
MATTTGRTRRRIAARLAAAAVAAVLAGTAVPAFAADTPSTPSPFTLAQAVKGKAGLAAAQQDEEEKSRIRPLFAVDRSDRAWMYLRDGNGGLAGRLSLDGLDARGLKDGAFVDQDGDSAPDGMWLWDTRGSLQYGGEDGSFRVGGGWNIYDKVLSPGNLGGAKGGDLLARDSSGTLYLYLGYGDGKLTSRYKVGGGWGQYTQIAGNGDLTGDSKADIVARDKAGTLWLYKGTGNHKAPFAQRTKIGGGWNAYNTLLSIGDVDVDGKTDLLARDGSGVLWLYKGTGNAATPYKQRVKIGGGWNTYRLLF